MRVPKTETHFQLETRSIEIPPTPSDPSLPPRPPILGGITDLTRLDGHQLCAGAEASTYPIRLDQKRSGAYFLLLQTPCRPFPFSPDSV